MANRTSGSLAVVVPPQIEPVDLEKIRGHLRIDIGEENSELAGYISAARVMVEEQTWRALLTQTLQYRLDAWPQGREILLPRPPLQSVSSVTLHLADGSSEVWDDAAYLVDPVAEPGRLVLGPGESWPRGTLRPAAGIVIEYVAGWPGVDAVPMPIRQAIQLMVGDWYENRENTLIERGANVASLPLSMKWLLIPYTLHDNRFLEQEQGLR
ncbi:MAG: hypothetical protein R6X32_06085 [Chloroflexota bacterium]